MSFFKLDLDTCRKIKETLSREGHPLSVRIEIRSTGCCDSSLGLIAGGIEETDLVEEVDGLKIFIKREIHNLVGEVTIAYVDDGQKQGFVLTSGKPLNEWEGFGVCSIRV
ncbi:MAG: hypothetical protein PHN75_16385 [Syntrophales bacterium]|nr:hypothetical protein [Syntrophales bacterium]